MIFRDYISRIEKVLDVPWPERKHLLDEINAHLEDVFEQNIRDGMDRDSAYNTAIQKLHVDAEFVSSMNDVHATLVKKALDRLPQSLLITIEYGVTGLVAVVIPVMVIAKEEAMIEFLLSGGFFMIPINLMGLAIIILAVERFYSLVIKKDHSPPNINRRLLSLKFLGLGTTLIGIIGTLMGFFQAFSAADRVMEKFNGVFPIYEVSKIAITTTIWGMTMSLVALCTYYLIKAKADRISDMQLP